MLQPVAQRYITYVVAPLTATASIQHLLQSAALQAVVTEHRKKKDFKDIAVIELCSLGWFQNTWSQKADCKFSRVCSQILK